MPSKTIDKNGKVLRRTPSTQDHPDGNRARTADGRVYDHHGNPVDPRASAKASPPPTTPDSDDGAS